MQEGLLDINVLRKYIVDVESILALRETCRFFAFRVFPKDWAFRQPCCVHKQIKHALNEHRNVYTVEQYMRFSFYGLKQTDDMSNVYAFLRTNFELLKVIVSNWTFKKYKSSRSSCHKKTTHITVMGAPFYATLFVLHENGHIEDGKKPPSFTLYDMIAFWRQRKVLRVATITPIA